MAKRPGGALSARPLHFVFLLDISGSMSVDGKIQALNQAIRESIPQMRSAARDNPNAQLLVRALTFSRGARWHVADPTPASELTWLDLDAGGHTDLGAALRLLGAELTDSAMPERSIPPVLVLVTDGYPTDDFQAALQAFLTLPWARRAVRLAIAIGRDANVAVLKAFIANPAIAPLTANNPEALVRYISWASVTGIRQVSMPLDPGAGHRVAQAPSVPLADSSDDVW